MSKPKARYSVLMPEGFFWGTVKKVLGSKLCSWHPILGDWQQFLLHHDTETRIVVSTTGNVVAVGLTFNCLPAITKVSSNLSEWIEILLI